MRLNETDLIHDAARNPKQEFQKFTRYIPAIKLAWQYAEKGNKTLRTKNKSEKMSVTIFRGIYVKSESRDNKRLTSKKSKDKETLHTKDKKKEMLLEGIEVKSEVRELKRLTLCEKLSVERAQTIPERVIGTKATKPQV